MIQQTASLMINNQELQVKAVGFDKDGTLFHAVSFWQHINYLRKNKFNQLLGKNESTLWDQLMGIASSGEIDHNGVLATATTEEEIILVAGLIYQIKAIPWSECRRMAQQVFEEADKLIQYHEAFKTNSCVPDIFWGLKKHGLYTGIITSDNLPRTKECMKMIGLEASLDFIVTPETVEKGKPHPEMVEKTCQLINIKPEELIVVGDSIVDMQMAKSAGSIAVGLITYEGSEEILKNEADFLIHSLCEIKINKNKA